MRKAKVIEKNRNEEDDFKEPHNSKKQRIKFKYFKWVDN